MNPGDKLFVYTDGITEATNSNYELFSESRLHKCLIDNAEKDVTDIVENVKKEVGEFVKGMPQSDDFTVLLLKYKGK